MIGQTIQHYRITAKLGEGGMGEVYLATDTKLGRQVALKFLPREFATDPERRQRLETEATTASSLDHPNILTIYEINEHDGHPFIAMAYVEGGCLKDKLAGGRLPLQQALRYGIHLASALGAAHARGIVHRDLKPGNVLIGKDDRARLTDFGLAKLKESPGLTTRGATVGTVGYMSPEQAQGLPVDARSDVFSLGVVLYEMLTGKLPFSAEHAAAALYSIVHEDPPPIRQVAPDVPGTVAGIVDRALAKKPVDRFTDGNALEQELRTVARSLELSQISSGAIPVARRQRRSRAAWAMSGAALLMFGLFLVFNPHVFQNDGTSHVQAEENTLAVMAFENLSDPDDRERVGDVITELLTTDLSGSEYVKVVSSQRLYDLAKHELGESAKRPDRGTAIGIARKAGASRMLSGALSKLGGRTIITAQLVDVSSGAVVGSERVDGTDLYAMVDELSVRIKRRIGLSEQQVQAGDLPVAEATTANVDAYRAYLRGLDFYHSIVWDSAHKYFDRALALDSNFALAHIRKGIAYFSDGQQEKGYIHFAAARRLIDRTTGCDRLLVQALAVDLVERNDFEACLRTLKQGTVECPTYKEFFFWVANFSFAFRNNADTAVVYAQKALELDPDYPYALLALEESLVKLKRYDAARPVAERYIRVRPGDAWPYILYGNILRYQRQFDSARVYFHRAIAVAPEERSGYRELARLFVLEGQPDSAIDWYSRTLASDNEYTRLLALMSTASVHKSWGRFQEALGYYRKADAMAQQAQLRDQQADVHEAIAKLYAETDRLDEALTEYVRLAKLDTISPRGEIGQVQIYARMGRSDEARRVGRKVDADWTGRIDSLRLRSGKEYTGGQIALTEGKYPAAIEQLLNARRLSNDTTWARLELGRAYLGAGQYDRAIAEFRALRDDAEVEWPSPDYLRGLYHLADALVKSGRQNEAVEPLQRLLVFWGNTDWDIPWMNDAKRLYGTLTAQ